MSIGAVLDETWTLFTRFFLRFFAIALVVFLVVNLLFGLVDAAISSDNAGAAVTVAILALVTVVIGMTWLQGAFVYAVQDARDGRFESSIGEVFSRVSSSIAPLIGASLLAGLGIAVGIVLLVVPGLVLLTLWAVIAPVIVIEKRRAVESFGRSRELVRGHGWTVFGIVVITGLLTTIASSLLEAAFSFLPRFLEIVIGGTIAQAVVAPFSAIAIAITYFRLRDVSTRAPTAVDA
ncbi:MAG: hypothetical protein WCE47_09930 [Gaiella sp.]|uniref:hypothetical protein n=1 Tax=Gaiella sp. TaxID=2663207 RepID=UPI003C78DE07